MQGENPVRYQATTADAYTAWDAKPVLQAREPWWTQDRKQHGECPILREGQQSNFCYTVQGGRESTRSIFAGRTKLRWMETGYRLVQNDSLSHSEYTETLTLRTYGNKPTETRHYLGRVNLRTLLQCPSQRFNSRVLTG
jgi:hypothetical protein